MAWFRECQSTRHAVTPSRSNADRCILHRKFVNILGGYLNTLTLENQICPHIRKALYVGVKLGTLEYNLFSDLNCRTSLVQDCKCNDSLSTRFAKLFPLWTVLEYYLESTLGYVTSHQTSREIPSSKPNFAAAFIVCFSTLYFKMIGSCDALYLYPPY